MCSTFSSDNHCIVEKVSIFAMMVMLLSIIHQHSEPIYVTSLLQRLHFVLSPVHVLFWFHMACSLAKSTVGFPSRLALMSFMMCNDARIYIQSQENNDTLQRFGVQSVRSTSTAKTQVEPFNKQVSAQVSWRWMWFAERAARWSATFMPGCVSLIRHLKIILHSDIQDN